MLGGRHGGGDGNNVWRDEQFLFGKWNVDQIGIGYTTAENKAHFLVVKDTTPPSYVCFQHNSDGSDRWKEVRGQEQGVNGNWHDAIDKNRSKVMCAFAFEDAPGPKDTSGLKVTLGLKAISEPRKAQKSQTRRFWSKLGCCC